MKKVGLGMLVLFIGILMAYKFETRAESVPTNITVGNSPPSFTSVPAEDPAGTLIDQGSDITFDAVANEPNSESYYLAICKTDSVTPGSGGSAPTCPGGTWCVSNSTSSDAQSSCSYTINGSENESSVWYGFVCDNNSTSSECSASSQGTGASGSPFSVNHYPTFATANATSSANPGGSINFTTIAYDSNSDNVRLVVCADTSGAAYAGCTGTQLCISSDSADNPTCQYNIPSVAENESINYYAYIFDEHGLGSSTNYKSGSFSVNNVAPTVSAVTINGGSDITLTEGTTINVVVTGTVSDNNSCQDLVTVEASAYRSSVTYAGCDTDAEDDNNDCYAQVSCSVSGGTCTGNTDASADYTCTVAVQYHADPTVASTQYPSDTWLSTINAVDSALSDNTEVAAGVEMNTLNAVNITGDPISFGNLNVGQRNSNLIDPITITGTGNIGYDVELSGTNLTDGGSGSINVNQIRYHPCDLRTYIGDGITLQSTPTLEHLDLAKTVTTGSPFSKTLYWGIEIPSDTPPGVFTGTNTVTSVMDESSGWGWEMFCFPP